MTDPIDLSRHAIVEASAGTGKTHMLLEIVLALIDRGLARLDEILMVTYTEKATGELKARLRSALEQPAAELSDSVQRARRLALDTIDQASVFTIHGFCKRVLDEFSFENGQDPTAELVDDAEILETCLREVQRRGWWSEYGSDLAAVLELSRYNSNSNRADQWERIVTNAARRFRPRAGQQLLPEADDRWFQNLQSRQGRIQQFLAKWRGRLAPLDPGRITEHPWYSNFMALPGRPSTINARCRDVLVPVLRWIADPSSEERPVATLLGLPNECGNAFTHYGFQAITSKLEAKSQGALAQACPGLEELVEELEKLHGDLEDDAPDRKLMARTVHQLLELMDHRKREHGLQSFEDMLTGLHDALDPRLNPQAEALLTHLRDRYRFAVVDEFQDTDPIQWRIFRRIFVEGAGPQRLIVVGDPKQAIYGFRGADVEAYLGARQELLREFGAQQKHLTTNWRTCPDLIERLNQLFERGEWFGPAEANANAIRYMPVSAPKEPRFQLMKDETGRSAWNAVSLIEFERLVLARHRYSDFVVREIQHLLSVPLEYSERGQRRILQAGDIAVLCMLRNELRRITKRLREARIPYTFYKQPGLWQSEEAAHLHYVLQAIARPSDREARSKAMLTRFFRRLPEELANADDLPPSHPTLELLGSWTGLADRRLWGELFQSLLEHSGVQFESFEGVDPDRAHANLKHISHDLEQTAYRKDLDLLGILGELETRRREETQTDANVHPLDSDRPKVRLMTIHTAKGLEFPVVFLAGGFTRGRTSDFLTYRAPDRSLIVDLRESTGETKGLAARESEGEERRLLYVALTRAIFKLYVPRLDASKTYNGYAGPLITVLAKALKLAWPETLEGEIDPSAPVPGSRRGGRVAKPKVRETMTFSGQLVPELDANLAQRRIVTRSFSSLHRMLTAAEGPRYAERPARGDDDASQAPVRSDELRGPIIGDMVHDILEVIDFAEVGRANGPDALLLDGSQTASLFERVVGRHAVRMDTRLSLTDLQALAVVQVARMVWNALHTPVPELGPLWQIPAHDRLAELEFQFPEALQAEPSSTIEEGFFTGFIDLVVRKEGRYHLIDWKTNSLPGYEVADVEECMRQADYVRQFRLYLHALSRWLGKGTLAGVHYLFVRGMTGRPDSPGLFFHRPTDDDLRLDLVLDARARGKRGGVE